MFGKTMRERIRNTKVRDILKLGRIKDEMKDRIRWYGHVKRMSTGRISEEAVKYTLEGKVPIGRPKWSWKKNVVVVVVVQWLDVVLSH